MTAISTEFTKIAWAAVGGDLDLSDPVVFTGAGGLPSSFAVTDLASAAIATAGLAIGELIREAGGELPSIRVDRRLSSIWFWASIRPLDWRPSPLWDPIAGDYQARDGWIRLHTNAPHHRAAAKRVLSAHGEREAVARAVAQWGKADLENAVNEAGGCAAEMHTLAEWEQHPQGRALALEPLVHSLAMEPAAKPNWQIPAGRPLKGLRVLDLTRVLAGPVASRFLAGYGAEVLRIDPPDWDEPGLVPEFTLGKRCARLDLREPSDRAIFERLLSSADVLFHGYRPGALDRLGFDAQRRRRLSPGLIDVCLNAYGWSGPWAMRRGFDSLVQMSTGIADFGMKQTLTNRPAPLPVQALDQATGYLMASAAIRGITLKIRQGKGTEARLSLARTAKLLIDHQLEYAQEPFAPETDADRSPEIELTDWGKAQRILAPVQIAGAPMRWDLPARKLGSVLPHWRDQ